MREQLKQLQDIFARSAFIVPDYQRGYAWSDAHRSDLLTDLQDLDALATDKIHYTGTVVLHRGRHASRSILGRNVDVLDIVDGQQRLTSLVILLAELAKRLGAFDAEDAKEAARNLRETYVAYRDLRKLTPNGGAATFFRDHIVGDTPNPSPQSPSQRALLDARHQFRGFIDEALEKCADDAAKIEWLSDWAKLVTTRLGFVVFEVTNEADVGVMFESMNARGKQLTQFELVKNHLLFAAARVATGESLTELTRDINDTWNTVVQTLDDADLSDDDDTFLRYHWYIWPGAVATEKASIDKTSDVHGAIKHTLRKAAKPDAISDLLRGYLNDLRRAVGAFADLSSPRARSFAFAGTSQSALVERALGVKRLKREALVMPLMMASVLRYGGEARELLEILRLSEAFTFRLSLLGLRANTAQSTLISLARHMRSASLSASSVQEKLRTLIDSYAGDKAVKAALLCADGDTPDGNFFEWSLLPHLLYEYERAMLEKASQKPTYDWEAFYVRWRESIEHILPQGDNTLKDPYWSQRFTPEQFARNRHRLGNLTLTEWNSHYGNRGFDRKRGSDETAHDEKVYRNSRFRSERELMEWNEWTERAIDERQQRLATFAMERWRR
jgi:hypothetical protein